RFRSGDVPAHAGAVDGVGDPAGDGDVLAVVGLALAVDGGDGPLARGGRGAAAVLVPEGRGAVSPPQAALLLFLFFGHGFVRGFRHGGGTQPARLARHEAAHGEHGSPRHEHRPQPTPHQHPHGRQTATVQGVTVERIRPDTSPLSRVLRIRRVRRLRRPPAVRGPAGAGAGCGPGRNRNPPVPGGGGALREPNPPEPGAGRRDPRARTLPCRAETARCASRTLLSRAQGGAIPVPEPSRAGRRWHAQRNRTFPASGAARRDPRAEPPYVAQGDAIRRPNPRYVAQGDATRRPNPRYVAQGGAIPGRNRWAAGRGGRTRRPRPARQGPVSPSGRCGRAGGPPRPCRPSTCAARSVRAGTP